MSLPDQTPKLPKLPFLIGDAILLGAAWYIANRDPGPLSTHAVAAVTACVVFAAIIVAIPFLTDYARKQDEALDERQRGLDALSRTINTAAEQISIAANGLHELTELTHKNLKHAENLPHKLQDKIAEFNAQLDNTRQDDREELEKELAELRTSETDRLQKVSDQVHKAVAELSQLESTLQQQLNGRTEQVEQARSSLSDAHAESLKALQEAHAAFARDLSAAQSGAIAAIEQKLADHAARAVSMIESALHKGGSAASSSTTSAPTFVEPNGETMAAEKLNPPDQLQDVAPPPRRPRKARREETPAVHVAAPTTELAGPATAEAEFNADKTGAISPTTSETPDHPAADASHSPPPFFEPVPVPAEAIIQIEPVVPDSAEPFTGSAPHSPASSKVESPAEENNETLPRSDAPSPAHETPGTDVSPAPTADRPARKRPVRQPAPAPTGPVQFELSDEPSTGLDITPGADAETVEPSISSDGATRLIATAYIGIGNRLFIRGEGPGLSWEKGVPLQFISIGKWRWESADAATPVHFKLYKNDDIECPGLGALVLEPGHQQEVTAKF